MTDKTGTLPDIIEWLRTKPPREKYNYYEATKCLAAQYYEARTGKVVRFGYFDDGKDYAEWTEPLHTIALDQPWTFGAALQRALDAQNL